MKNILSISNLVLLTLFALFFLFIARQWNFSILPELVQSSQKLKNQLPRQNVEDEYAAGLKAIDAQNWARAIIRFENILKLDQNYLDAQKKLAYAELRLQQESIIIILADYYNKGKEAMARNNLRIAKAIFEEVNKFDSNYMNTKSLLRKIKEKMAITELDSLCEEGSTLMSQENWIGAILIFEKIKILHPSYKDVNILLTEALSRHQMAEKKHADPMVSLEAGQSLFKYWIILVVVALLGIFSLVLLRGLRLAPESIRQQLK